MKRSHFLLTSNWMSPFYAALWHISICSHSSHKTSRYTFQESENHWSHYQLLIRNKIGSEFAFGIIPCEPAWSNAVRSSREGAEGSNWRQNKMHCCGIPPPTQSPCSLARVYSSHGCWGAYVHSYCVSDQHVYASARAWVRFQCTPSFISLLVTLSPLFLC